ncbi:MAG: hypothetical protein ACREIP_09745, partial [Alphaproteobacteria bacterium]
MKLFSTPIDLVAHGRFYVRHRVVRLREAVGVLLLATLSVAAETGGVAMMLPILSFVEHGRNVEVFARSSELGAIIVDVYRWAGVPVSLLTLSAAAMSFILLRQGINYFNSIEIERVKWKIGRRISVKVFEALLGSKAENIRGYKPGEFTVTAEYECQATAAVARVYG